MQFIPAWLNATGGYDLSANKEGFIMLPNRRFTHRPALQQKQRNRGLLLDALETGLAVQKVATGLYLVESSALNGSYYQVIVCPGGTALPESFACSCDWTAKQVATAWAVGSDVLPCKHELLVFWYRLPAIRRTALSLADPVLLAAEMAGATAYADRAAAGARVAEGARSLCGAVPVAEAAAGPSNPDSIHVASALVALGSGRG
jgi:hypothetical protein